MSNDLNYATSDPALASLVRFYLDEPDAQRLIDLLVRLGADAATRLSRLADAADRNPPVLRQWDGAGNRIDEIDFHESYRELSSAAFGEYGLAAVSHRPMHGWTTTPPPLVKYAMSYVFMQAEYGLGCPVNMTDSAARTLRRFGDPATFGEIIERLSTDDLDVLYQGAMFMTEKQGGSDLAQTETVAVPDGDAWRLTGRKWFASNAAADIILTLARFPGGDPDSTRGIGLFMLPKRLPDGSRNSYTIDRLKNKLGTKSMASGEVTLNGAYALQVGQLDRGMVQMLDMVNSSRLSNLMRSSALIRRAVYEAVGYARERYVFGDVLFDKPLLRMTLLPMQLESEAATAMIFYCAEMLRRGDGGDAAAGDIVRILTPVGKFYICKAARGITGESMEIRGGDGYIEDSVHSRLVRDAHLASIWEGTSNIIALDVLRAMRKSAAHQPLIAAMRTKLTGFADPDVASTAEVIGGLWDRIEQTAERILAADNPDAEARMTAFTTRLATATMATLLLEQAQFAIDSGAGYRALLVANSYLGLIAGDLDGEPPVAISWLGPIVDGESVPREAAIAALDQLRAASPFIVG